MPEKLKSRKFWMAVVGGLLVVANEGLELGIDPQTVLNFSALVLGWIFAEAYVDGHKS